VILLFEPTGCHGPCQTSETPQVSGDLSRGEEAKFAARNYARMADDAPVRAALSRRARKESALNGFMRKAPQNFSSWPIYFNTASTKTAVP